MVAARPHPAYPLGWGRTSCLAYVFGENNQWASLKSIAERCFRRIAALERGFGTTIKKGQTVEDMAQRGKEFVSDKPRRLAIIIAEVFFLSEGEVWKAPDGAPKRCGGPS